MNRKPNPSPEPAALRRRAEARLQEQRPETGRSDTEADLQRCVHELQVHQVELEMQNEELQQTRHEAEALLEKYSELYDFAPVGYLTLDREGTIHEANLTCTTLLGIERSRLIKQRLGRWVSAADQCAFSAFLTRVFESKAGESCEVMLLRDGKPPIVTRIEAAVCASGQQCRGAVMDVTERKQAEVKRERLIQELQTALALVKSLQGLLSICAGCKKIRDGQGDWNRIETYIETHSAATFSHGLCPDCIKKYYPELEEP